MATVSRPMGILLASPFLLVGYQLKMQKIYLARQAFRSSRLSPHIGSLRNLVGGTAVIFCLITSCSSHQTKSTQQKIEFYESKARHYQQLSDLQRLSPPFCSSTHKGIPSLRNQGHMRTIYQREARRYEKLADKTREELNQDSNRSVEKKN